MWWVPGAFQHLTAFVSRPRLVNYFRVPIPSLNFKFRFHCCLYYLGQLWSMDQSPGAWVLSALVWYLGCHYQMLWLSWVMLVDTVSGPSAIQVVDCNTRMCAHTQTHSHSHTPHTYSLVSPALNFQWNHNPCSLLWFASFTQCLRPSHCLVVAVFPLFHLFSLLHNFSLFIPRFILSTASSFGILKNAEIHIHELIFWYTYANVSLRSFSRSVIVGLKGGTRHIFLSNCK